MSFSRPRPLTEFGFLTNFLVLRKLDLKTSEPDVKMNMSSSILHHPKGR